MANANQKQGLGADFLIKDVALGKLAIIGSGTWYGQFHYCVSDRIICQCDKRFLLKRLKFHYFSIDFFFSRL